MTAVRRAVVLTLVIITALTAPALLLYPPAWLLILAGWNL